MPFGHRQPSMPEGHRQPSMPEGHRLTVHTDPFLMKV